MFINFWYVAEESKNVTDQPVHVRMLSQDFVLFRGADGTARCLSNVCIHRGGSLAHGKLKGDCVECPITAGDMTAPVSAAEFRHSARTPSSPAALKLTLTRHRKSTDLFLHFSVTCQKRHGRQSCQFPKQVMTRGDPPCFATILTSITSARSKTALTWRITSTRIRFKCSRRVMSVFRFPIWISRTTGWLGIRHPPDDAGRNNGS